LKKIVDSGPKMTPELSLLFGGRVYDDRTLFIHGANINAMQDTEKLCPECTGVDFCKMPQRGWQCFFDARDADFYKLPAFWWGQCHFQKREYMNESASTQIAPRFQSMSLLSFKTNNDNKMAFEKVRDYANSLGVDTKHGLLLIGSVGTGKTHLATAVLRCAQKIGFPFGFVITPDLMDELRPGKDDGQLADTVKSKHVLLLDDLGTEKPSDWVSEKLYQLINYRYNYELPTLITSNYTVDELKKRLGENGPKIVDRIMGMCSVVMVGGPSWRRKR
jgi:DNA replication protein DnaC